MKAMKILDRPWEEKTQPIQCLGSWQDLSRQPVCRTGERQDASATSLGTSPPPSIPRKYTPEFIFKATISNEPGWFWSQDLSRSQSSFPGPQEFFFRKDPPKLLICASAVSFLGTWTAKWKQTWAKNPLARLPKSGNVELAGHSSGCLEI